MLFRVLSLFSVDNTKMKRGWSNPFFNYIKINWRMWVSYSFKVAFDYSLLYLSIHFWCHDTTLKKIFSIEKLNLTWNKQTNFNKLDPLSRLSQIALRGRRDGEFEWGKFFYWVVGIWEGLILTTQAFFKAKNNIL